LFRCLRFFTAQEDSHHAEAEKDEQQVDCGL